MHTFSSRWSLRAAISRNSLVRFVAAFSFVITLLSTQRAYATPAASTVTLAITPATTVNAGTVVAMTANVLAGATPVRGQVDFCLASASFCTGSAVIASVQTTTLGNAVYRYVPGAGSYSIKAVFHATSSVLGGASAAQTLTVNGIGSYATATSIASSGTAGNYTLTGTVAGFGRQPSSGTVTFLNTSAANAQVGSATIDTASVSQSFATPPSTPQSVSGGKVMKGDFNNDGILDLISTGLYSDGISIALGVGDGTFQTPVGYSAGTKPFGIGIADLNGDGNLDIVVSNYNPVQPNPGYMTVLLGNGDGTFQTAVTYNGSLNSGGVALGDFNKDGFLDVVLMNSGNVGIFIGNGDGTFQAQVTYTVPQGIPVAVGDFNGDGNLDIVVGDQDRSIGILLGNGDGTFQSVVTYSAGYTAEGIVVGDFNGDGKLDIATANFDDNTMGVLIGVGDGTFPTNVSYSTGNNSQPYDIASGDFNGDGIQDLVVSGLFGATSSHIFMGVGDGTFQPAIGVDTGFYNLGVTGGDFNGDGLDDFAATNYINGSIGVELSELAVTAVATGVTVPGPSNQNVDASYAGDTPHSGSLSSTVALAPLPSTTTLAVSPDSVAAGASITFTATVSPTPSSSGSAGTITFYRGGSLLGTVNVIGTSASYTTTSLPAGRSAVSAVYSGNSVLGSSTSNSVLVFVGPQSSLALAVSSNAATAGTPITLTATGVLVAGSAALTPGLVAFNYQETVNGISYSGSFGTAQLNSSGVAKLTVEPGAGVYSVAAAFTGTATAGPSASTAQTLTINGNAGYATATNVASSGSVGDYTLTATVAGFGLIPPSGQISFLNTTAANQSVATAALDTSSVTQSFVVGANSPLTNTNVQYVVTADFNGDGIADIATANTDGTVKVQIGLGNNTFHSAVSYAISSNLNQVLATDVNGDGKLDLEVVSANDGTVSILLGNGDGTFQTPSGSQILTAGSSPDFIAVADLNSDGNPDIVVINQNDSNAGVFLGNGDGTFQSQQTYSTGNGPNSVLIADFNHDGAPDLAVTNQYDGTISILLGNGDGSFQPQNTLSSPYGDAFGVLAAGSLRNNGIVDLVAPDLYSPVIFVYLGNGDGSFQNPVTYNSSNSGVQATLTDLNHDGKLDLVAAYPSQVAYFYGAGDGTFGSEVTLSTGNGVNNVALADLNNDGLTDFITSNTGDNTTTILLGQQATTATATAVYVTGTGQQAVAASYPGDTIHAASISSTVLLDPSVQTASTTVLTASPTQTSPGTQVTLTATVSPVPTGPTLGSVSFYNGATLLGTVTVNSSGVATFATSTLPGGVDALTAAYSGCASTASSTSAVVNETVTVSTTTSLTTSSNNPSAGQSVTLTATVAPTPTGSPLGSVNFYKGSTLLGSGTLSSGGVATLTLTTLPTGTDVITAVYSGNTVHTTSTSSTITITVGPDATSTVLGTSSASPSSGQSITLTATVTPAPTGTTLGTVSFYSGTTLLGTSTPSAGGIATLQTSTLPVGSNSITAVYSGNASYATSTSSPLNITVSTVATSTALTSSSVSPSSGQSITLTATVTPAPSGTTLGTVSFYRGAALLGTGTLSAGGVATLQTSTLPVGSDSITAVYSGNASYATSTSSPLTITVSTIATSTALTSPSVNPSSGQSITLTATVTPIPSGTTLGTVSFYHGTALLGTGTLSTGGVATLQTSTLPVGSDSITAVYSGNASYAASTSSALTITVSTIATSTALTSSGSSSILGQNVTLTATVTPAPTGTTTGTVTFFSGSTSLGSGPVSSLGVATIQTSTLPVGSDSITAVYSGNATYATSTSSPLLVTVSANTTSTALTTSSASTAHGQSVTLTATVSPTPTGTPLGTVAFYSGSISLGSGTLSASGTASLVTTALPTGNDSITAVYSGNNVFAGSTSVPVSVVVAATATSMALTSSNSAPEFGQAVTLTATISPASTDTAAGTVAFSIGSTLLGSQAVNAQGVASITTSTIPSGTHSITAAYSGSANFAGSTSSVSIVVKGTTTATLAATPTTQLATMPVTMTAQVSSTAPGVETGTFSFFDGTTLLGTSPVQTNGQAVYTTSSLSSGSHSLSATYSGDGNFLSSTSTAIASVTVADVNLDLGGDQNKTVLPGAAVTYSFPLSPLVTPTFLYDVTLTASGLPPGATYTFTPASIPAGSGTIPVALTIQTAKTTAMMEKPGSKDNSRGLVAMAFLLLLPLGRPRRLRKLRRSLPGLMSALVFAGLALAAIGGLSGCASGGFFGQTNKSYTITVTATSGTLVRTSTVQLNLQ